MSNRIIPLARLADVQDIDDSEQATGDWPIIEELCKSARSPTGQCEYGGPDDSVCIYCGSASGVW